MTTSVMIIRPCENESVAFNDQALQWKLSHRPKIEKLEKEARSYISGLALG